MGVRKILQFKYYISRRKCLVALRTSNLVTLPSSHMHFTVAVYTEPLRDEKEQRGAGKQSAISIRRSSIAEHLTTKKYCI